MLRKNVIESVRIKNLLKTDNVKNFSFHLLFNFLCTLVLYIFFMTNNLFNTHDGLWHIGGDFAWYDGALSQGRWLWYIIDNLRHYIISVQPAHTLISIFYISLGTTLIIGMFEYFNYKGLIIQTLISSCATITMLMSYVYAQHVLLRSFVFFALSLWIITRKLPDNIKLTLSIVFFIVAMGSHQDLFGVYTVVAIFYIIDRIIGGEEVKRTICFLKNVIITFIIGSILYFIIWIVISQVVGVPRSSYGGANNLNVLQMVINIPSVICKNYRYFYDYLFHNIFQHNPFYEYWEYKVLVSLLLLLVAVVPFIVANAKIKKTYLLFYLFAPAVVIPTMYLTPNNTMGVQAQLTIGCSLFLPMCLLVLFRCIDKYVIMKWNKVIRVFISIITAFLLYSHLYQVAIDCDTMYNTRRSTESIVNDICIMLMQNGVYNTEYRYVFIGRPADNELFKANPSSKYANGNYVVGRFLNNIDGIMASYNGFINSYLRLNFKLPNKDVYSQLVEKYKNNDILESFPSENCYYLENNIVVIKVSN